MKNLLDFTISAHGGLDNWKRFSSITAKLHCEGVLWALKQQEGIVEDVYVTSQTRTEATSHFPFLKQGWRSSFTPDHISILDENGNVVEEMANPRASFAGHVTETPWSALQLAYFGGYAMWTYFNTPFDFASAGYQTRELEPWMEDGQEFRRLEVTFPKNIATHSEVQTFYISEDGLIRRHDYNVDIAGGSPAAHYLSNYMEIEGVMIATRRDVFIRAEDNTAVKSGPLLVSIDLSEIVLV